MKSIIHIGLAEDHDLLRRGLVMLLKSNPKIKVDFDVNNGVLLLEQLKKSRPDLILLDIEMPQMSGKEALEVIRQHYPDLKVIILSAFFEESHVVEYVKMGVNAFLPKDSSMDVLTQAISEVQEKGYYFDSTVSAMLAKGVSRPGNPAELSPQETEIIRLICQHQSSKEIADQLGLSKKTIDYHRSKIMRKTGTGSISELMTYAVKNKIVVIR